MSKKQHTEEKVHATADLAPIEPSATGTQETCESIEIGEHKYGVETVNGQKFVMGVVIGGEQYPPAELIPEGYALKIDAGAALEQSADQG